MNPVVTLTLNPAIDLTVTLERLEPGRVHRAQGARADAGGKGLNVARCLADWGVPVAACGLLGRDNAGRSRRVLARKGIADRLIRVPGETRTNLKLLDRASGDTTDVNLPGLAAGPGDLAAVAASLADLAVPGGLVVLAGSLPGGLAPDTYADLTATLKARGARVVLDASGPALAAALAAARPCPDLVKPNRHGWRRGRSAADEPRSRGGGRKRPAPARRSPRRGLARGGGALFVADGETWHAHPPAIPVASTVGAGDALVAGLVAGLHAGLPLTDTARLALAFAAGKLTRPGANLPDRATVEALRPRSASIPSPDHQAQPRRTPWPRCSPWSEGESFRPRRSRRRGPAQGGEPAQPADRPRTARPRRRHGAPEDAIRGARAVLLVGSGDLGEGRFEALHRARAALADVLADAGAVLDRALGAAPPAAAATPKRIVAITSCPTGIAHTFMAAEGLQAAAAALGHAVRVETQGSVGAPRRPHARRDRGGRPRADRRGYRGRSQPVRRQAALRHHRQGGDPRRQGPDRHRPRRGAGAGGGRGRVRRGRPPGRRGGKAGAYKHLMTGVSFMLPFVVAGACSSPSPSRSAASTRWRPDGPAASATPSARSAPRAPSRSSSRRSPATSPIRSPTGPASRRA